MKKSEIVIYTDGSSIGNPGPGGWGAVLLSFQQNDKLKIENEKFKVIELGGREEESTNNRMEITGALEALRLVEKRKLGGKSIIVHSDSNYLIDGITGWIYLWMKNGWRTAAKGPVLNRDLWEALFKIENNLKIKYEIKWAKVKGHAGILLNERSDAIAVSFAAGKRCLLFTGNLKDYRRLFGGS
jgi:ribonuclease HI